MKAGERLFVVVTGKICLPNRRHMPYTQQAYSIPPCAARRALCWRRREEEEKLYARNKKKGTFVQHTMAAAACDMPSIRSTQNISPSEESCCYFRVLPFRLSGRRACDSRSSRGASKSKTPSPPKPEYRRAAETRAAYGVLRRYVYEIEFLPAV